MTDPIGAALSEEFAALRQAVPTAFTPPPASAVFATARTRTVRRRVLVGAAAVVAAIAVVAGTTLLPGPAVHLPMPPADIETTPVATATAPAGTSGPTGSTAPTSSGATASLPATSGSGRSGQP